MQARLGYNKDAGQKLRWSDGEFHVYVNRDLVPAPVPSEIIVDVELGTTSDGDDVLRRSRTGLSGIFQQEREHTKTVRYWPEKYPDRWQAYVPKWLLTSLRGQGPEAAARLRPAGAPRSKAWPERIRITVRWVHP